MRHVEDRIQMEVIKFCRSTPALSLAFHIENEGKEFIQQAVRAKRMGRLAGLPDICIPMAGGRVLWLELKTSTGRVSATQKDLHKKLIALGHTVEVAKGLKEAINVLKRYI